MKILTFHPEDEGYTPGPVALNHEEGVLHIGRGTPCDLEESRESLPESLSLRCFLKPMRFEGKSPFVQLISEKTPLEPVLLYKEEAVIEGYDREKAFSSFQSIGVIYAGQGSGQKRGGETFPIKGNHFEGGHLEIPDPLYIKPFRVEKEDLKIRRTTVGEGQVLTSPPGVLNTVTLRGYGGYYKRGRPLTECEQIYYTLTSDYEQTRVSLYRSSFLKAQGILSPEGGRTARETFLFSPPPGEEEYLSFSDAVAAGHVRLKVLTDEEKLSYASSFAEVLPAYPYLITLHFNLI